MVTGGRTDTTLPLCEQCAHALKQAALRELCARSMPQKVPSYSLMEPLLSGRSQLFVVCSSIHFVLYTGTATSDVGSEHTHTAVKKERQNKERK